MFALLPPHVHQHVAAQQEHLPHLPPQVGVCQCAQAGAGHTWSPDPGAAPNSDIARARECGSTRGVHWWMCPCWTISVASRFFSIRRAAHAHAIGVHALHTPHTHEAVRREGKFNASSAKCKVHSPNPSPFFWRAATGQVTTGLPEARSRGRATRGEPVAGRLDRSVSSLLDVARPSD